ncbi:hypothetical protein HY745_03275 [Candidatus Desantisbacteria bacterium]|nr:hypothetical protein [Candidatus Desantisbacteria bacterium]
MFNKKNGRCLMNIKEIPINIILPDNEIGMVFMQPYVELSSSEPYHWQPDKKSKQIERIIRTLEIAKKAEHGCPKTHFTIFPEYSIPGLDVVQNIQNFLLDNSWQNGTIVIGGVDGLTKNEYATLCNNEDTIGIDPTTIPDGQWINCGMLWAKQEDGALKCWLQPKLSAAWPEQNISYNKMFTGDMIYLFSAKFSNGIVCRFLFLICFDWIAQFDQKSGIDYVLNKINDSWINTEFNRRELHMFFVIQCNEKPNHISFLENARNLFSNTSNNPAIIRENGTIFFANTAGNNKPGKCENHGNSSLVFPNNAYPIDNACPPTFALTTKKIRDTDSLGNCQDALFREAGACIHSFKFIPRIFLNRDPSGRKQPIETAIVYPIDNNHDDPRVSGKPVPASIKWINDKLDEKSCFLCNQDEYLLYNNIDQTYESISKEIRNKDGKFLTNFISRSICKEDDPKEKIVDVWDEQEELSLKTIIDSLCIIGACFPVDIGNNHTHGTMKNNNNVFDIIVISGNKHDNCIQYIKKHYPGSGQRFLVLITRDQNNDIYVSRTVKSIYDVDDNNKDTNITNPQNNYLHCSYHELRDQYIKAQDINELSNELKGILKI